MMAGAARPKPARPEHPCLRVTRAGATIAAN